MYHAIGSSALGDELGIYSLHPTLFRQHMDYLAEHHQGQVCALDPSRPFGQKTEIAITFDDGYLDNLTVAAPILVERGIPFTVFVVSDFVRDRRSGFLDPTSLRELAGLPGVTIGAHGATHVALSACNDAEALHEFISSRHYLEDVLGREVTTMAYPYGATNRHIRSLAAQADYQRATCSQAGVNRVGRDPLLLARTDITAHDSLRVFRQKLHGDWDWYRWRQQDPACL